MKIISNLKILLSWQLLALLFLLANTNTGFAMQPNTEHAMEIGDESGSRKRLLYSTVRGEEKGKEVENSEEENKKHKSENDEVTKIIEEMKYIDTLSETWRNTDKVTIIIGNTGAGKSTIFDYQTGTSLVAIKPSSEYEDKLDIVRKDNNRSNGDERRGIGNGAGSSTTYPDYLCSYFDCPGFGDTRGCTQDIINGYSLFKIFKKVTNFELIIAANIGIIDFSNSRGDNFVRLIGEIEKLFPVGVGAISHGLTLVFTRGEQKGDHHGSSDQYHKESAKYKINKILNERKGTPGFTPFQEDFMTFFTTNGAEQLAFFNNPSCEGSVICDLKLKKSIGYITSITPRISVSDNTKQYISGIAENFSTKVSNIIAELSNNIQINIDNIIKQHTGKAKELRSIFGSNLKYMNYLLETENIDDHIECFTEVLKTFKPERTKEFTNNMDHFKFLVNIDSSILKSYPFSNKKAEITNIKNFIEPLSKNPIGVDLDPLFIIKGCIVGTSDVVEPKFTTKLALLAKNVLLIDSDVSRPGTSIAFIAPLWMITDEITVNIAGDNYNQKLSKAKKGKDGAPGVPGQSGGKFYGRVKEILPIRNGKLTINTSGGNGGDGQDGSDGKRGENGKDGDLKLVESRNCESVKKETIKGNPYIQVLKAPFVANVSTRYSYSDGTMGTKGGNSGAGGQGGYGGNAGKISISLNGVKVTPRDLEDKSIFIKAEKGDGGKDGKHGTPGKGGKNGAIYKGVYVENILNGKECLKKGFSQSGLYAAGLFGTLGFVGGSIGPGVGALIGAGAGFATPFLGSVVEDYFTDGWERKPGKEDSDETEPDGDIPGKANGEGINKPEDAPKIDTKELSRIISGTTHY